MVEKQKNSTINTTTISNLKNNSPKKTKFEIEKELILKAKKNDQKSIEILLENYKGLIKKYAIKYMNILNVKGMELEDLYVAGQLGLLNAIEKYDPNKNCLLSTYATYSIINYILNALREENSLIRLNSRQINKIIQLNKKSNNNSVNKEINYYNVDLVENSRILEKYSSKENEVISAENSYYENISRENLEYHLHQSFSNLNKLEKMIIWQLYGFDFGHETTLRKISKHTPYKYSKLKQSRDSALKKIKNYFDQNNLEFSDFFN